MSLQFHSHSHTCASLCDILKTSMAKGKSSGVVRRKSGCTRPRRPTPRRSVDGSLPWNPIRSQWDPYLNQEDFVEVILTG